VLGAHYAGASAEVVEALGRFGRYVGQAFQIADDLLDLSGDEKATGKTLGTDVEQGKLTLPLIHLLRGAPERLAGRARQILAGTDNHRREGLRPLLIEAGSLEYARGRALRLTEQARRELACLPASPCRSILEYVTDRVVHRDC
jgi:octaprenyl-diphosphate synthase